MLREARGILLVGVGKAVSKSWKSSDVLVI
jgi:hypothetical protein